MVYDGSLYNCYVKLKKPILNTSWHKKTKHEKQTETIAKWFYKLKKLILNTSSLKTA